MEPWPAIGRWMQKHGGIHILCPEEGENAKANAGLKARSNAFFNRFISIWNLPKQASAL